ncbi:MAG: DUF2723 domain-containing protein [Chloroflexi bacterium]|nr:DUF2723 domain-containing protein [Chloroflexota bacterium]
MTFFALDRRARLALILFLLLAAGLYLATLDNGLRTADLEGGDLITHQYAQVQGRPSNAPGYPLYTMGGWLWFHGWRLLAPTANPVPILSAYSTLWALLALALLFLLLYRFSQGNLIVTMGLSAFYAVSYFFWFYSVTTEQYTSAVLHTLLIVALLYAWEADPRDVYLYALAFVLGLALAHMITVLFIGPGALIFVLNRQPQLWRRGRLILKAAVLALLPLLSYIFIYVRGAQHPEWRGVGEWPNTWAWFLSFIATKQGQDELTWTLGPFTDEFPSLIWGELTVLIIILGVVGWLVYSRRTAWLFGLTAVITFVFCYIDRFGNWYQVIMPLYPLLVLGAGISFSRLWRQYAARWWRISLILLLLGLFVYRFALSVPGANQHNRPDDTGLVPGWLILADDPPAGAAIVTTVEEKLALDYLTLIWGQRSDVSVVSAGAMAALLPVRPVLVTQAAADYAAATSGLDLRYNAWGPTLLLAAPAHLPVLKLDDYTPVRQDLGDGLQWLGVRVRQDAAPGEWVVWVALGVQNSPQNDWSLSLRLLVDGNEVAQQDHAAPALGQSRTTLLRPGDVVVDAFRFAVPAAPQALRLILYRRLADGSFENLSVVDVPLGQ